MRKIYTIGETVLDILFENYQPFAAKPGGACLNTSITLGRLNVPVFFISEFGMDETGNYINSFLLENNVSTEYIYRYCDGKSALALAFLNKNKDATYDFYKIYPQKRLQINLPEIHPNDIILFGSMFAITKEVRPKLLDFIKKVKKNKGIIIYDPNFRKSHLNKLNELKPMIIENIKFADIIRGSDEDFSFIFGTYNAQETYNEISNYCKILLYTSSTNNITIITPNFIKNYPIKNISPKSTIGAGDNFNAGVIYSIYKMNINKEDLLTIDEKKWDAIAEISIDFATEVCLNYDNYISHEFAKKYKF